MKQYFNKVLIPKHSLYFLCSLGLLLLLNLSCGKSFEPDASSVRGDALIQIATSTYNVPDAHQEPLQFQVVPVKGIIDLSTMTGLYGVFYSNASKTDQSVKGSQPKALFLKNKAGVFIPRNSETLQMATLYYHAQNMKLLEQKLNLDSGANKPINFVINTKINDESLSENNAFYDPEVNAIVYSKYTENSLPIRLNGGIFAHEFFHSIFHKLVKSKLQKNELFSLPITINKLKPLTLPSNLEKIKLESQIKTKEILHSNDTVLNKDEIKWYYSFLIKAFDEGLADVWGYNYTNDAQFVFRSLPEKVQHHRDINTQSSPNQLAWLSELDFLSIAKIPADSDLIKLDIINFYAYELGTKLAILFRQVKDTLINESKLSAEDASLEISKDVISLSKKILDAFATALPTSNQTDLISFYQPILDFAKDKIFKSDSTCRIFLNMLVNTKRLDALSACKKNNIGFSIEVVDLNKKLPGITE